MTENLSSLIELLQLEIPLCPLAIFEWHTEAVNLRAGVVLDLTLRALLLQAEARGPPLARLIELRRFKSAGFQKQRECFRTHSSGAAADFQPVPQLHVQEQEAMRKQFIRDDG